MGLDCGGVFAKVVLVIINIVYMMFGLGLSGFGVFFLVHHDETEFVTGSYTVGGSVALIVGGVFTIVIAVLGIVAAAGELYPLLIAYIFFMMTLVGIHVVAAALSFYSKGKIQHQVEKQFEEYISEYRAPGEDDYDEIANDFVDAIQTALKCCGLNGPQDWLISHYVLNDNRFPESCECDTNDYDYDDGSCYVVSLFTDIGVWSKGCNESLYSIISFNSVLLGGSAMGIVTVQMITVLISIALCACIISARSQERRRDRVHSVAYTPLESYPTNTITNQFEPVDFMPDVKM